jgi:hypothetical protein
MRSLGSVPMANSTERVVLGSLVGLALALLVVGVVSGTLLRHVIQIVPIIAAILLFWRRADYLAYAALPLFTFWLFIVALIWLFLLGVSRIANGHYTATEIAMTVLIAGCSLAGGVKSVRVGKPLRPLVRVFTFALFAALQVASMVLSLREPFAHR